MTLVKPLNYTIGNTTLVVLMVRSSIRPFVLYLKKFFSFLGVFIVKKNSTGKFSVFTRFEDYFEIMFHVSTFLPYFPEDEQQLERKRYCIFFFYTPQLVVHLLFYFFLIFPLTICVILFFF